MKHTSIFLAILSLALTMLACQPVIAIGWEELLVLIILIAFLLGPTLFKLYRFLDKIQKARDLENKKKK
jgi:hypothetical protein